MKRFACLVAFAVPLPVAVLVACGTSDPAPATDPPAAPPTATSPAEPTPDVDARDASTDAARPPVDAAAASLSIAQFDQAMADAICKRLASCCNDGDYATFFEQFKAKPYTLTAAPAPAACAAELAKQYGQLHGKWAASIAKGRMTYSAARGKTCVDAVTAAACGVPLSQAIYDARCLAPRGNEVFQKVAPLGSDCDDIGDGTFYGECDPKLGFCGSAKKCEAWKKTGEPCGVIPTRAFCAPDLACEGLTPKAPGSCSGPPIVRNVGETCDSATGPFEDCVAGTYCADTGKCAPLKTDGVSCTFDFECSTSHPYTCGTSSAGGARTCGSTSFCAGRADAGADGGS